MSVAAIIAEYNPFHNGHLYQIEEIKKQLNSDYIISIMSSSFVQRGEPAIYDKFSRARLAVENGVNMVIELPVYFSIQSAENFARGAITILDKTNIVDNLVFGTDSDYNELEGLYQTIIENKKDYEDLLLYFFEQGNSYTASFYKTLHKLGIKTKLGSNDILALEYMKNLNNTKIRPFPILRRGASYLSEERVNNFSSATYIRKEIKNNNYDTIKDQIPENTYNLIKSAGHNNLENYFYILKYKTFVEETSFYKVIQYENGMGNLIRKNLMDAKNMEDLINMSTSKRYSRSRIARFIIAYLLEIEELDKDYINNSLYLRPLAFDQKGEELFERLKVMSDLPILSKFSKYYKENNSNQLLNYEIKATNLYNIVKMKEINEDFIKSPEKLV